MDVVPDETFAGLFARLLLRELLTALGDQLLRLFKVAGSFGQRPSAIHHRRVRGLAKRLDVGRVRAIGIYHFSVFRFLA